MYIVYKFFKEFK